MGEGRTAEAANQTCEITTCFRTHPCRSVKLTNSQFSGQCCFGNVSLNPYEMEPFTERLRFDRNAVPILTTALFRVKLSTALRLCKTQKCCGSIACWDFQSWRGIGIQQAASSGKFYRLRLGCDVLNSTFAINQQAHLLLSAGHPPGATFGGFLEPGRLCILRLRRQSLVNKFKIRAWRGPPCFVRVEHAHEFPPFLNGWFGGDKNNLRTEPEGFSPIERPYVSSAELALSDAERKLFKTLDAAGRLLERERIALSYSKQKLHDA